MKLNQILLKTIIIFFIFVVSIFAQQESEIYEYPIKPGMSAWNKLTTHQQMLDVLSIPENMLNSMSTKILVKTCLSYPLYPDMWAFLSLQEGFEDVIAGFNGLQELLKRQDVGMELVKLYKNMEPGDFNSSWSTLRKGQFFAEYAKIEILMAQKEVLTSMQETSRLVLLEEALKKHKSMVQYPGYDMNSLEPNTFLMSQILLKDYKEPLIQKIEKDDVLKNFLENGSMAEIATIDVIINIVESYIYNH